jgi:superoxide dismutase, Cu-Zn family
MSFGMKMLAGMAIVASAFFYSCNNEEKTTDTITDSVVTVPDSMPGMPMPDTASVPMVKHAEAALNGTYPDTSVTGKAIFDADSSKGNVKMVIEITVPAKANKNVAVHIHEHGDCGDKANMAHGHWNPTNAQHGKWGSDAFHLGDIGNIKLDGKGKGKLTVTTDLWTLGGAASRNILGKALIVHGGEDDYKTQPTGNAGTRIGCGVIR